MDSNIEQQVLSAKRKKMIIVITVSLGLLLILVFVLRTTFKTSLKLTQLSTATVERGDIENTINATGEVLPEFEQQISSPVAATIQKILIDAGTPVRSGQSVLMLDKSAALTAYEKMKFQVASKQNDIRKIKLELDKSFYDVKSSNNIKQLRINSLKATVENTRRLLKAGGGTREDVEQAQLELKVAELEKKQLENEVLNKQQTMRLQIKEAELSASIQQNELQELSRQLRQADILSGLNGVVTYVNKNIGAAVQPGEVIAKIADLSDFKVKGTLADNFIEKLKLGMTAIIRINDIQVRGKVITIYPAVENGTVSFDIQPDEKNAKLFRPHIKTDIFLVTDKRTNVLRVSNGQFFKGAAKESLYVLKNGVAHKKVVGIGLSNFDYVELLDQVKAGDVIITSDLSAYKNSNEIGITP